MKAVPGDVASLFRVVDASDVEKTVLRDAERRVRDATIPRFTVASGLGYGPASLGNFCADVDSLVLRMAADAARREGQQLRESGVANLAARDRVQMKEQILKGLLLRRSIDEGDGTNKGARGAVEDLDGASLADSDEDVSVDRIDRFGDERHHREELIKKGTITPLDVITDGASTALRRRGRVSLMEHKIAEGMTVKLPRPRRAKVRIRQQAKDNPGAERDSRIERDGVTTEQLYPPRDEAFIESPTYVSKQPRTQGLSDGLEGQCQKCSNRTDDAPVCPACLERRSKENPTTTAWRHGSVDEVTEEQGRRQSAVERSKANSVECPICAQVVRVDDPAHPDVSLSKHMDRCDRRRERGRASGQAIDEKDFGEESSPHSRSLPEQPIGRKRLGTRGNANDGIRQHDRDRAETHSNRSGNTNPGRWIDSGKRRKAGKREVSRQDDADTSDTEVSSEALTGRQELIDDYEDADFEARKEDLLDGPLSAVVDEESGSHDGTADLGDGLTMDGGIANRLFQYQLTGIRWMWQLHRQGAGGIIGDEMGLGKTVQVASYLGALHRGGVVRRVLVLCPATVLAHWMAELHAWAPQLRVVVLHRCVQAFNAAAGSSGKIRNFLRRVLGWPNVVVLASYEGLKSLKALLLPCNWDYGILDEGQRIRNPDAEVTLLCKQIRTVHRLVVTGTPIQNNLRELWSLFDFVFPGRLGTLPAFEAEFANPMRVGGYANASPMQVRLAYRCALVLRDLIHPYLLRRLKKDLEDIIHLPSKTEQVLFCRLTSYQRHLYSCFLDSTEVKSVLSRTMRAFRAISILRKLCNHPDLVCRVGDSVATRFASHSVWTKDSDDSGDEEQMYKEAKDDEHGAPQRSGKLLVLKQILPLWHQQGHRVLLFSQTRQMLNIIESFVKSMSWSYGRLDGNTPVGKRQSLIDSFNGDDTMFIMLLTTRTGGVGINLTGADRVILFDPDWNPSTDMQARERSWRVGQLRQVTVYRLITAGTVEEKIYHRQIFKTALTNQVLQDPKQRRMFSADELGNLFTLGDDGSLDGFTDTVDLFQGEGKIDAPKRDQQESSRRRSRTIEVGKRKRRGKRATSRHRRSHSEGSSEGESEPSALLGTATVALEPTGEGGDSVDGTDADGGDQKSKSDDAAVLQALYEGAPLSSVFHHDLAEGAGVMSVEQKRMEEAAKRAAQRALEQLRRSRPNIRAGAGQVGFHSSWTGRNGGASQDDSLQTASRRGAQAASINGNAGRRFGNVAIPGFTVGRSGNDSSGQEGSFFDRAPRGLGLAEGQSAGMTSQDILRHLRERNQAQSSPAPGLFPEFQESASSTSKDAHYAALLQRLEDYLVQAPSGVDTATLIQDFGNLPPEDVPVFRQLLRALAVCSNGEWKLRETGTAG